MSHFESARILYFFQKLKKTASFNDEKMIRRDNGKLMDDDGFVLVESRKHRRRKTRRRGHERKRKIVKSHKGNRTSNYDDVSIDGDEEETKRYVRTATGQLKSSGFYDDVISSIREAVAGRTVQEIVCYGIGRVSAYKNSRVQFAMATLLKANLRPVKGASFFDPFTSELDTNIMTSAGFKNIDQNEEGKRPAKGVTIYFMPHCDLWLYSNVLWANWSEAKLRNTIVVGNSFKAYNTNSAFTGWKIDPDENCVFRSIDLIQETNILVPRSASSSIQNAFNNTCVIHFPNLACDRASSILSRKPKEFFYHDSSKAS